MLRLIVLITLVLLVVAFRYLPWWLLVSIVVVLILLRRFLFGWVVGLVLLISVGGLGKVLRGATVDVHNVRPTERPATLSSAPELGQIETTPHEESEVQAAAEEADEGAAAQSAGPRNWFEVDITITPRPLTKNQFPVWDVEGLRLTKPGSSLKEEDDSCYVASVQAVPEGVVLLTPGQTGPTDADENFGKMTGPARLKMVIGVRPDVRQLVFRYFSEAFGSLVVREAQTTGI
jgi:hypothetical protein